MAPLWQARPIHRMADVYAMLLWGAARESNRLWQEKSRKVRPVGLARSIHNFNRPANIASVLPNLPLLPRRCRRKAFDPLRRSS